MAPNFTISFTNHRHWVWSLKNNFPLWNPSLVDETTNCFIACTNKKDVICSWEKGPSDRLSLGFSGLYSYPQPTSGILNFNLTGKMIKMEKREDHNYKQLVTFAKENLFWFAFSIISFKDYCLPVFAMSLEKWAENNEGPVRRSAFVLSLLDIRVITLTPPNYWNRMKKEA